MPVWIIPVVIVVLIAVLVVAFITATRANEKKMLARADYVTEPDPLQQRRATVVSRSACRQETGTIKLPDHRIAYSAVFRLEGGAELLLEVDEAAYGQLAPGMEDVLITQAGNFVGFGDIGSLAE